MNPKIKFFKNWNNKLNCDNFTTIRLYTKAKYDYYCEQLSDGDVNIYFDVVLNGIKFCTAWLMDIEIIKLGDIKEWLSLTDAGLYKNQFYDLMKKMYSKKPEWANENTKLILLCFKKYHGDEE